jgi:cardiolipin synthase
MQVQAAAHRVQRLATLPAGVHLPEPEIHERAALPQASLPLLAPVGGSSVRLLVDEGEVLPEMLAAARAAQRSIDLTMFSLADSGAGRELIDALVERSRSGVDVRVTVDQVGSAILPVGDGRAMQRRLEDAGVEFAVNRRIDGGRLNPVDHRKLMVVDDEVAFTGGMNFSKKFGDWHDVMVRVDGPAAARLGAHFVDRWVDLVGPGATTRRTSPPPSSPAVAQAGEGVALLANFPGRDLHASDHLLENLGKARDRAWILTPTLSDPAVVDALTDAARRGVDTRVAVSGPEGWIGTRALRLVGSTYYRELVNAGVKVYEQPGMSHAKVSLVDDVASVGSLNMTRRAMLWDHELQLASDRRPFVEQVERLFETDFAASTLVDRDRANSAAHRIGETVRRGTGLKW